MSETPNATTIAAFIEKLPALNMHWPQEMQEQWWSWVATIVRWIDALDGPTREPEYSI